MRIKRFVCNAFQENCYVVSDGGRCIIIDPGFAPALPGQAGPAPGAFSRNGLQSNAEGAASCPAGEIAALFDYLKSEPLTPEAILLTHSHWDHILGVRPLADGFGLPVYCACGTIQTPAGATACLPAKDGDIISGFKVIATPGHTPDSVCYYNESEHIIFTGDTLFAGAIGRTDLPGGDYDSEIRSIMEKLVFLPGETAVYPGHGPASTIARERMQNPFLEPFNEREELDLG